MNIPFDKYRSVEELVDEVNTGLDIEFEYQGKEYSICPTEKGPTIAEAYREDETGITFRDGQDLVENYIIEGKKLKEIATEINVIAH